MDFFQIGHKSNTKVLFNLKGKPVYNIQKQYLDDLPVFEECSYLINCVVEKSRLLNFDIEDINFGFYFDAPDVELELISIKSEKHMFYISIGGVKHLLEKLLVNIGGQERVCSHHNLKDGLKEDYTSKEAAELLLKELLKIKDIFDKAPTQNLKDDAEIFTITKEQNFKYNPVVYFFYFYWLLWLPFR